MERKKLLGWLALGMVATALFTVLCVTLQEDSDKREAKKVRQMSERVAPHSDSNLRLTSTHAAARN